MSDVASACKKCYAYKKPCNFFVQEVAKIVKVPLPSDGTADELIEAAGIHWMSLTEHDAIVAAGRGEFVIAGMTSTELNEQKGHVAVVMPGRVGGFPKVASTNEGDSRFGKSNGSTPLTEIFPAKKVRAYKVRYFTSPGRGIPGPW